MESIMPGAVVPIPLTATPSSLATLRLDFGCGPNPREGFEGVDALPFDGKVKHVMNVVERIDLGKWSPWPWADNSVVEAHSSHFVEHLDAVERVHFVNELYRVLVPGGKCTIIVPHWASCRAYGDPQHKWPPVSEFWFYYLSREWRMGNPAKGLGANAPHTDKSNWPDGFDCDFDAVWGYGMHPELVLKSQAVQQFNMAWYKEAISDIHATLTKK